ncbi:MAG: SdrD B-like domain-containing protein, partial [Marinicella sp.]
DGFVQDFAIHNLDSTGEYTVRVTIDSNSEVVESNEHNNSTFKVIQVIDDAQPDLSLLLDANEVYPRQAISGFMQVYNPGVAFNGSVNVKLIDTQGFAVGIEDNYSVVDLSQSSSWTQPFNWNSTDVFAGNYQVEASLYDQNHLLVEQQVKALEIKESAEFQLQLSTSSAQVQINQVINFNAEVTYQVGNTLQSGVLTWQVFDDSQQLIWSDMQNLSTMSPGFRATIENPWISSQTGSFELRATLTTPLAEVSGTLPFEVIPQTPQLNLNGTIEPLAAGIILGQNWNSEYTVSNPGQVDVSTIPVKIALWDNDLSGLLFEQNTSVSLISGTQAHMDANWTSDTLDLANYVLVLTADLSGIGGSAETLLDTLVVETVDLTAPEIIINGPINAAYYQSNVELMATVTDQHSSVSQLDVYLDNDFVVTLPGDQLNGIHQHWLTGLSEGQHTINVVATDIYQNSSSQSVTFNVDNTAPQIDVTGVIDAGLYNSTVQPVIHITDANLSQSQITLDGVLFNSGDMVSIEGNHLILVSATDLAGNLATKRVAFNLDLTAPVVVITYPVNGSETNQDTTIVSGQTEVDATVSIMAGAYQDSTVADFEGGFSFADVPLSSGENIISVAATDLAGNAGLESQVTVTYVDTVNVNGSISADLTHPIGQNLSINWSVNNENNFNELGLPVAVTMYRVSDNALLRTDTQSIDLDPVATFNGNTIFVTDDLSAGDYRLQLSAEIDGIMQNLDDHLLTLQDVIGPDLIVFEPTSGQVSTAALEVLAQAVDLHSEIDEVSYQLDNSGTWLPLSWNGSQYSVLLNLLHGDHLIVVRAIDIHGNESTSAEIDFIIDTLAPEIVINSPTDGLITNQPVTIAYTVTDDNNYSDSAELNLNAVSDGDLITAEGDYELTVNALDEVNNESNATHQFIIDTTAPVVVVDHPLDGHQNTSGMIDVSGSSEPRNAIVITVNGIERNMKTDDNGMFTSQDHALQIGNNEIVVTATDQAGNVSLPVLRNVIYSQVGSVIGRVWEDANSDAIIDIGETGFNQILVELTDVDNNTSQVFTDINGYFEFSDLSPGDYNIEVSDGELLTQWINTTNNNPQTISVNADLSTVIDFGFYQDKPILDAEVTANNLKGRLLVLVDTPTAQVDFGQCVGVSSWKMQKNVAHDFSSGDVIWAKLLNAQGTLLQTESASYEEFAANGFQVIDDEAETNEYNLVLQTMDNSHMRAFVNSSSLANPSILSEPYQLILGHQIDGISTEYSSDLVVHDCSTYNQIGNQSGELQLFSVGLNPALASDDANSSSQAQHLVSQQLLLEGMLDDSGWSYHITSDSVEFANQMATGAYVSYWLIAENVKLSSTLQSDLMAEMNEGASLVVSSGQANLNESFYSTLGVHVDGIHADANFIELSDSLISNRVDLPILLDEPVLKASLMGAESVGVFTGSGITAPENIALTWSDDLAGIGVFSGIDWLLQASEELGLSQYTQLMKDVLEFVHPLGLSTQLGRARAVQFEMLNNGRNVDGYVHVKLPVGVSLAYAPVVVSTTPEGFTFEYELLENQSLSHEFWLTVSSSPVTVNFDIHLDEETEVFESLGITLIAGELPDLQASITNCVAGVKPEQSLIYEMTITNTGNKVINGAIAHAEFSSGLTEPNWTCIGVNGGVCLDLSGTGDLIGGVVNLPLDSSVVYRFETDAMISPVTAIQSIGSVQMPVGITDVNPANNDTIDVDSVYQYIFKHSFDCAAAGTGVTQNKSSVLTMEGH